MDGHGIYVDGKLVAWFALSEEACGYASLCSTYYNMRPTTVGILNDVTPKASEEALGVPKSLTRGAWLSLNPLSIFMRDNSISYTGMSVLTNSLIKPYRLQRMSIGFEEPTVREYEALAIATESTYIITQRDWHTWFSAMPDTAFEGGIQ